jgi:hypothetical protein
LKESITSFYNFFCRQGCGQIGPTAKATHLHPFVDRQTKSIQVQLTCSNARDGKRGCARHHRAAVAVRHAWCHVRWCRIAAPATSRGSRSTHRSVTSPFIKEFTTKRSLLLYIRTRNLAASSVSTTPPRGCPCFHFSVEKSEARFF